MCYYTSKVTFSPSLTSISSSGETIVGLAPLFDLDGRFATGEPGAVPSVLSLKSTDSIHKEKSNYFINIVMLKKSPESYIIF